MTMSEDAKEARRDFITPIAVEIRKHSIKGDATAADRVAGSILLLALEINSLRLVLEDAK